MPSLEKLKIFEEIKKAKDFDTLVDLLYELIDIVENVSKIKNVVKGEKGDNPTKDEIIKLIKPLIPNPIKGDSYILTEQDKQQIASTIKVPIVEKVIETIIEKQPIVTNEIKEVAIADTPEMIVSKLESLEEGERLKIEAIEDLREELDKLKKEVKTKGGVVYAGGGLRRKTTSYDLSSKLNGVLKTFSLPAFWDIVSVHTGGSIPTTFRPITDFTSDADAMTITFTSEIDAASTLATNQTIIVVFNEL